MARPRVVKITRGATGYEEVRIMITIVFLWSTSFKLASLLLVFFADNTPLILGAGLGFGVLVIILLAAVLYYR